MVPAKSTPKPMTPGSVKGLMVVEAAVIVFLAFWVYSEYLYNLYFQSYVNLVILQNLTSYLAFIGLAVGLTGSIVAVTLWKSFNRTRHQMATSARPRVVEPVREAPPSASPIDASPVSLPGSASETSLEPLDQPTPVGVADEKK